MIYKIVYTKNGQFLSDSIQAEYMGQAIDKLIDKHGTKQSPLKDIRIVMAHE